MNVAIAAVAAAAAAAAANTKVVHGDFYIKNIYKTEVVPCMKTRKTRFYKWPSPCANVQST